MKEILQEGVSNIVYHFTTLGALENIIANNRINFSDASSNQVDMSCQPEGYKYYLSLTRQSSPMVGYPGMMNIGDKNISSRLTEDVADDRYKKTRTRQLDQFGLEPLVRRKNYKQYDKNAPDSELTPKQVLAKRVDRMVKPTAKFVNDKGTTTFAIDKNQSSNRDKISQNSETEERIFSKTSTFENVYDYILRIDILPFLKKLKVRICFDGNKINQNFLGGPVDYIYKKYINGVKYSTLAEARGRKPKGQLMDKEEWQILRDCLSIIQIEKETGKDTFEKRKINWADKIFLHLSSRTMNLGNPMLAKYLGGDIMNGNNLGKMMKQNAVGKRVKKTTSDPNLKDGEINKLIKFVFVLTPPGSKSQKTKLCKNFFQKYFGDVVVIYDNKKYQLSSLLTKYLGTADAIWDWWNSVTRVQSKFNRMSFFISSAYKDFNGSLRVIYERLDKMFGDFLKDNGLKKIGQIVNNQWNKYYRQGELSKRGRKPKQAIAITEEDIKEMVTEAIKRII